MGASQSDESSSTVPQVEPTGPLTTKNPTDSNVEYVDSQAIHELGIQPRMISSNSQCMLIGSYGDKYNSAGDIVPKKSDKPGGKFLKGVSDDLEIIQDMIRNDPRKNLAYVLPDVPGAQRPAASYLAKIEKLLKESKDCGVLIWYTGHGQRNTGNWCFTDAKISFDQIFHLYEKHFRGCMLTIISDCCYSGQWPNRLAEKLDTKGIGACGHKAVEAGYLIKIFASCLANEVSYDTYYAKKGVYVQPSSSSSSLMVFRFHGMIKNGNYSQTACGIDTTELNCFQQEHSEACRYDQIPPRASWKWRNLTHFEQVRSVKRRLFRIWCSEGGQRSWRLMIIYADMFDEFCTLYKTEWPTNVDYDRYGYTIFWGIGENPPEDIFYHFTKCGPAVCNLPRTRPTSVTAVHSS